jgi:DNA-binding transcriptional LysR family regulator
MLFWHRFPSPRPDRLLKTSLRYFIFVLQHGPIRAATELGVAQAAISRQIQALEYELGPPLLEKGGHAGSRPVKPI